MEILSLIVIGLVIVFVMVTVITANKSPYLSARQKANWTYIMIAVPPLGSLVYVMFSRVKRANKRSA